MDSKTESELIINSINDFKKDIEKNNKSINNEADIQYRLFYYISKNIEQYEPGNFRRLTGEYPAYVKNKNEETNCATELAKQKKYISHIKFIDENQNDKPFHERIIVQGKYDLALLDKDFKKAKHVIEIKYQDEKAIYPKETSCFKTLEDIYALTDFIKNKEYRSDKIAPNCKSYNIIYIDYSDTKRNDDYFKKISNYLSGLKKTYEEAKIDYLNIILDNNLKNAAINESIELNNIEINNIK